MSKLVPIGLGAAAVIAVLVIGYPVPRFAQLRAWADRRPAARHAPRRRRVLRRAPVGWHASRSAADPDLHLADASGSPLSCPEGCDRSSGDEPLDGSPAATRYTDPYCRRVHGPGLSRPPVPGLRLAARSSRFHGPDERVAETHRSAVDRAGTSRRQDEPPAIGATDAESADATATAWLAARSGLDRIGPPTISSGPDATSAVRSYEAWFEEVLATVQLAARGCRRSWRRPRRPEPIACPRSPSASIAHEYDARAARSAAGRPRWRRIRRPRRAAD